MSASRTRCGGPDSKIQEFYDLQGTSRTGGVHTIIYEKTVQTG